MFGNVLGYVLFYIYKAPDYARIPRPFMRGSAPGYARTKSETPPDMRGPAPDYAKPTRNPKLTAGPFSGVRTRLCVVINGGIPRARNAKVPPIMRGQRSRDAPESAWGQSSRPPPNMGHRVQATPLIMRGKREPNL